MSAPRLKLGHVDVTTIDADSASLVWNWAANAPHTWHFASQYQVLPQMPVITLSGVVRYGAFNRVSSWTWAYLTQSMFSTLFTALDSKWSSKVTIKIYNQQSNVWQYFQCVAALNIEQSMESANNTGFRNVTLTFSAAREIYP